MRFEEAFMIALANGRASGSNEPYEAVCSQSEFADETRQPQRGLIRIFLNCTFEPK